MEWLSRQWADNKPKETRVEAYKSLNATVRLYEPVSVVGRNGKVLDIAAGAEVVIYGDPAAKKGVVTAATVRSDEYVYNILSSGAVRDVTPPRSPNAPPARAVDSTSWYVTAN